MLDQYVNDRPYVASSFMSVAIARIFNSALAGNSKGRPELVNRASASHRRVSQFCPAVAVKISCVDCLSHLGIR